MPANVRTLAALSKGTAQPDKAGVATPRQSKTSSDMRPKVASTRTRHKTKHKQTPCCTPYIPYIREAKKQKEKDDTVPQETPVQAT